MKTVFSTPGFLAMRKDMVVIATRIYGGEDGSDRKRDEAVSVDPE